MKKNLCIKVITVMLPLLFFSLWTYAQSRTIKGSIIDETNFPLVGVNVIIQGTTTGTISDFNGNYVIEAESKDSLIFSFIGFEDKVIPVGNQTEINVVMNSSNLSVDEVVVVGYGTQRKEAVTGSVASIKGDVIRDVPSSNVTQSLQGRISGVEMAQTSTKPGATMQIRIRGTRSLNASNDPLIVLDGIPFAGAISDVNPSDIKSIDILKDASATAIYGSRGANGVILITTNKGNKGQKAKFSYNSYVGLKSVFSKYPMMDGPDFVKLRETAGLYTNNTDESNDTNTDWQDLLYRTAKVTSHDVGVSGGTEHGSYNFGVGYYFDESVLPLQDFTRYSMHASLDQDLGKYVKVGFSSQNNYSVTNGDNINVGANLSTTPISDPYNEDGSLKRTVKMGADENWVYTKKSLESLDDSYKNQTKAYGTYNNLYGEVKVPGVDGLKYRLNLGLNLRMTDAGSYTGEGVFSSDEDNISSASISHSIKTNWAIENLLTYDKVFAGKHKFNVVALYSSEKTSYNSSYVSATDIPSDAFQYYNLGRAEGDITINPDYQGYYESGLKSYMGRVMYSYDDRYMISAAFRSDGSSVLAKGHKWHSYPAVSLGWNLTKESFMQNLSQINLLKLRVGYGQTANQAIDAYSTLGLLSTRPYNFNDANSVGYYVSKLPNENLGWEYSETWNYGVDFGAFNNRLTGTVEYYYQKTHDLLLSVTLPKTSGVDSYYANVGKTENKGIELTLNGTILDNYNGWTWDVGFNLYANRNKLIELASGREEDESNWWFKGHAIDVIYDYKKEGLWQKDDAYRNILEPGDDDEILGSIKVKYTGDYNEDGSPTRVIGTDDRQIMDVNPDFQGGFNTRVAYKGFDLSVVGAFKKGGILISTLYGSSSYLNMLNGRRGNVDVDYWTENNTDAKYPSPKGIKSSDNPKYGSTLGYFDASYMKIRTITLGYDLKRINWIRNAGIEKFRIYFTAQNPLVMFSPYNRESGMDPETNSYGDENQAVNSYKERLLIIGTNTPTTRNYMIGLNLTF